MADPELTRVLAELVKLQAQRGSPQMSTGAGNAILSTTPVAPLQTDPVSREDVRGPTPVMRVLDVMSRPLYGAANVIQGNIEQFRETGDAGRLIADSAADVLIPGHGAADWWEGIAGRDKTTGADLLETAGVPPGVGRAVGSFALDIGLDPLTYVGTGAAKNVLGAGVRRSLGALGQVERGSGEAAQSIARELSERAAVNADELPIVETYQRTRTPRPAEPSLNAAQEPPRTFVAGPGNRDYYAQRRTGEPLQLPPGPSGSTIDPPTERPRTVREILEGTIEEENVRWRNLVERQIQQAPNELVDEDVIVSMLRLQQVSTNNPITQNMVRMQLRKLDPKLRPEYVVQTIRKNPIDFPDLESLSDVRRSRATTIANNFTRSNKELRLNPEAQIKLFDRIRKWVAGNVAKNKQSVTAFHMLRVAEDRLLQRGKHLIDGEGQPARLSDYINMLGHNNVTPDMLKAFVDARPSRQIEEIATRSLPSTKDPVFSVASEIAREMTEELPPTRINQEAKALADAFREISEEAGASAQYAKTAKDFIADLFDPKRDEIYSEIKQQARNLMRQSMEGKIDAKTIHRVNNKVYEALDGNPKVFGRQAQQNRVVEAIMMRFATWWNAKDLRPFAREYIDTARNIAAAFEKSLSPLIRSTRPTQREQAWRVAQGRINPASPEEAELAKKFQYMVESLVGAHGIKNVDSVLVRGGTTLADLNKELPRKFQFSNKKGVDATGREFDYTDGNWMHSWKEWEVKEPAEALYALTRALQMATRKNSMLDDAAARWGMPVRSGEFRHTVDIPRLEGFYFPKQIADQLNAVWNRLETDVFNPGGKFMQMVDKLQRMWKSGVTIYSPSHHIRNLNGDIFLSALDGVTSVTPYRMSAKVIHAYRNRYKAAEDVMNIMDPALKDTLTNVRSGDVLFTTKGGVPVTIEQIYMGAENQGFLLRAADIEDLFGSESSFGTFGARFAPFGGRVHNVATKASELRDHWVRMAHFIDIVRKSKSKNLRDVFQEAGYRVKKWHPDGSDLTGFEQNVMRRLIPFYSWTRKSVPLLIEGAAMRPHITLAFPRAMAAMQEVTGIESEGPANPFPEDQVFPQWLREKGVGPIIPPDSPLSTIGRHHNARGEVHGYTIINPTNPFMDLFAEYSNPQTAVRSSLTPFIGVPIDLMTGTTSLGIPFENVQGGAAGHVASTIPPVGIGARVTGLTRSDEPYHPEAFYNWLLTSGAITGTGPYRQQGSYEIAEHIRRIGEENRGR